MRPLILDVPDKVAALAHLSLFDGCDTDEIEQIAMDGAVFAYDDAEEIIAQGDTEQHFFIILSGTAEVFRESKAIDLLGPGDFLGELAAINRTSRSATVVSTGGTTCLRLDATEFRPMLVRNPRVALRILDAELSRLQGNAFGLESGSPG